MRIAKVFLLLAAALLVASLPAQAGETTWWKTDIFLTENPKCVVIEQQLYCPSGIKGVVLTYTPVESPKILGQIRRKSAASKIQPDNR